MSSDSLAAFRKSLGPQLSELAERHLQHDLQETDRATLNSAASTVATHTRVGSIVGISLGLLLAFRLRSSRAKLFSAFRAAEQPTTIRFSSGREEALPDLRPMMKPSTLGDVATYLFLGGGGLFFGGETGLLTGTLRAKQVIGADRESRERIRNAFRNFQADALRRQADLIEKGDREGGSL